MWESAKTLATEGASSKKTLGTNLSGRWNHNGTHLWRARISIYATKGEDSMNYMRVKLSGKRTEKGKSAALPFSVLFCVQKIQKSSET